MEKLRKDITLYCVRHNKAIVNPLLVEYSNENDNFIIVNTDQSDMIGNLNRFGRCLNEFIVHYWITKQNISTDYVGLCHYRYIPVIRDINKFELDENTIVGTENIAHGKIMTRGMLYIYEPWVCRTFKRFSDYLTFIEVLKKLYPIYFDNFKSNSNIIDTFLKETFICTVKEHKDIVRETISTMIVFMHKIGIRNTKDFFNYIGASKSPRILGFCFEIVMDIVMTCKCYNGYNCLYTKVDHDIKKSLN